MEIKTEDFGVNIEGTEGRSTGSPSNHADGSVRLGGREDSFDVAGKVQLNPRRPERGGVLSTGLYLTQLIDSLFYQMCYP